MLWNGCCCDGECCDGFSSDRGCYLKTPSNANFSVDLVNGLLVCEDDPGSATDTDTGTYTRLLARPELSGLVVMVRSEVESAPTAAGTVIGRYGSELAIWTRRDGTSDSEWTVNHSGGTATGTVASVGSDYKIELVDVSSGAGTYDVKFYLDDVLVHAEAGVALDLSDAYLHLGVWCDGGGEWDQVCFSPCPECDPGVFCGPCDAAPPMLDVAFAYGAGTPCCDPTDPDPPVVYKSINEFDACVWWACGGVTLINIDLETCDPGHSMGLAFALTVNWVGGVVDNGLRYLAAVNYFVQGTIAGTPFGGLLRVNYELETAASDADCAAERTLTRVNSGGYDWLFCAVPASVTVTPKYATEPCVGAPPALCDPNSDADYLAASFVLAGGVSFRVCMTRFSTQGWSGIAAIDYDTCSGVTLIVTLLCVEVSEGVYEWRLRIENVAAGVTDEWEVTPQNEDTLFLASASGTLTDLCGATDVAGTASIDTCDGDPDLPACCSEEWGCCYPFVWVIDQTFNTGTHTIRVFGSLEWVEADGVWRGDLDWSISGPGGCSSSVTWTGVELACSGSSGGELSGPDIGTPVAATESICGGSALFEDITSPVLCGVGEEDPDTVPLDLTFLAIF